MLITPLIAGLGGLLAFFAVVFVVVWLPIHTFDPPASGGLGAAHRPGRQGAQPVRRERLLRLPLRLLAPAGRALGLYFLYPKVSQPGDFYGSDQSPNLLGTERTGPDLSQESGWHPDDWQRAHFYDPRFIDPLSLMPPMKSLFSDKQVEQLITYVQTRSGKSGLLRYAGQLYAKHVVLTVQGFPPPYTGFQGAHKPTLEPKRRSSRRRTSSRRRRTSRRSTAATGSPGNPLPVTEHNLLRGKEVYLDRCVGCHGVKGDGKGPAAPFLSPTPRRLRRQGRPVLRRGHLARRLLLPHPARLAGHRDGELRRPPVASTTSGGSSCS